MAKREDWTIELKLTDVSEMKALWVYLCFVPVLMEDEIFSMGVLFTSCPDLDLLIFPFKMNKQKKNEL